jgi:hypothetical protein
MAKAHRNDPARKQMLTDRRISQTVRDADMQMRREKEIKKGLAVVSAAKTDEEKAEGIKIIEAAAKMVIFTASPAKPRRSIRGLRARPWLTKKNTKGRKKSKTEYTADLIVRRALEAARAAKAEAAKETIVEA